MCCFQRRAVDAVAALEWITLQRSGTVLCFARWDKLYIEPQTKGSKNIEPFVLGYRLLTPISIIVFGDAASIEAGLNS